MTRRASLILAVLTAHRGESSAISAKCLAATLDIPEREVREIISDLRTLYCKPICATPDVGYFLPTSRAEAEHTLLSLRSRAAAIMKVAGGIEKGLSIAFGQEQYPMFPRLPVDGVSELGVPSRRVA